MGVLQIRYLKFLMNRTNNILIFRFLLKAGMSNTFCRVGIYGLVDFPPLIEEFATKQSILHVNNI